MNSSGHLPVSEKAARRKTKAQRKTKGRARNSTAARVEKEPAAIGSLTRTKALLLAALRVWELKHRIGE
jgi:hypothetical protein